MAARRVFVAVVFAAMLVARTRGQNDTQTAACSSAPAPPTGVVAKVLGATLTLTWTAPPGSIQQHSVEFGNAPGSTYLGTVDTGSREPLFTKTVDPGIYFVRVRAINACGASGPSAETRVAVSSGRLGVRTTPDVVVARRTPSRNTFFPTAERLKNGHVLVVYYDSPDHVSPGGRISMVRSEDEGRTWSAPEVVIDGPRDDRDPSIMQISDGTLLVSYFEADAGQSPTSLGVFVARSSDEGRTWSEPRAVETSIRGAATSSKIVELPGGDLLLPMYGILSGSTHAVSVAARSSDGGRTWMRDREATIARGDDVDFEEPAVASLGGGRLLAMIRTDGADRFAYESHSTDDGVSWSRPVRTPLVAQSSDLLPIVDDSGRRLLVHTWGDTSGRFGDSRPTMLQILRIDDFPILKEVEPVRLVHAGHCWTDEGQPSSIQLPNRRVFSVYYDACAGYIGGTFSDLPNIDATPACTGPVPPALRVVSNRDGIVSLEWTGPRRPGTSYILEAGRSPGSSDIDTIAMGGATSFTSSKVGPGTYYVRVRSKDQCGAGKPSNEVAVVVR